MTVQVRKFIAGETWDEDAGKPLFCVRVYLGERANGDVSRLPYYKQVQAVIHYNLCEMDDGWLCGGDYLNKQDAEDMAEKVRDICRTSRGMTAVDNEGSKPNGAGRPEPAGHHELPELFKLPTHEYVYLVSLAGTGLMFGEFRASIKLSGSSESVSPCGDGSENNFSQVIRMC